jgi:hypothetical protein
VNPPGQTTSAAAIRWFPLPTPAPPVAGGWGNPGSLHVYNVGLIRHPSGGVEEVAWSGWNLEVEVVLFGGAARWSTAMDMPLPHARSFMEL